MKKIATTTFGEYYAASSTPELKRIYEHLSARMIVERTRTGGAEIVKYLKTGSAYYAPSAAAVQMCEAIALDRKRILPCAAWLAGEYGMKDIFLGVPCKLGRKGLEQIIEVELTGDEKTALGKSADAVRELIAAIKL